MGILDDYKPEEGHKRMEPGDHRLKITSVMEKTSRNGNPMFEIGLVSNSGMKFRHFIVKNEYFNEKMTVFYDSFSIPRGNKDLLKWTGKVGAAHIDYEKEKLDGGQRYLEVKYFLTDRLPQACRKYFR
jgi:hypothetical protein